MALEGVSEEERAFESMRADLVRTDPGRFAVVCGERLLGIFSSVDRALTEASRAFDGGELPEGAPVLISEIAERTSVRVMARPDPSPPADAASGIVG
jgi:hypothetical protein